MEPKTSYSGFTLIELSIVLIIISLIVAGITGGQALIRQAELRSIAKDIQKYQTAINSFRLQYDAIPGDFIAAQNYWPPPDCVDQPGISKCNGNDSGKVGAAATNREDIRMWQHLSLAELVDGSYDGVHDGSAGGMIIGTTIPESDITSAGWRVFWWNGLEYQGHHLQLGTINTAASGLPNGGALSPPDTKALDLKIDDGRAGMGNLRTSNVGGPCVAGIAPQTTYNLNDKNVRCAPSFLIDR